MFYHLFVPLADHFTGFNVFRYITFRAAWGMITALAFCYLVFPRFIEWMRNRKMAQIIRTDGLCTSLGIVVSVLLWARLDQPLIWISLAVFVGYSLIGLVDDWKKVMLHSSAGLAGRYKLLWQFLIGLGALGTAYVMGWMDPVLVLPFFKGATIYFDHLWTGCPMWLGWLYVGFAVFVLMSMSNAVNLSDGLDGLAIGPVMTSGLTYGILAYLVGNVKFSAYLQLPYVPGAGELSVLAMALVGAGLGFLWFNTYPAQVFMGDVGSLSLGGLLGVLAVLTKHEMLLLLVGGIFVLEAVSVVVQVASFKLTGKRVFAMAPIHHHYEKKGWSEPKIIVRFWIISLLLALVALTTLKLR
jgi:phospho-N-acetylmuramoyl-pentapeptide-transferase